MELGVLRVILTFVKAFLVGRAALAVENIALRLQLTALQRSIKRSKLRNRDRVFWS